MKMIFEKLHRLPMLALAAASVPLAWSVEDAVAGSFCADINRLVAEAPKDFSGVTLKFDGASDCAVRSLQQSSARPPSPFGLSEKVEKESASSRVVFIEARSALKSVPRTTSTPS